MEIKNTEIVAEQANATAITEKPARDLRAERRERAAARKKNQIWNMVFLGMFALMFVLEIITMVAVIRLGMLPGVLIALIVVLFFAYDCLTAWFMFLRGKKVPKNKIKQTIRKRRIIACVLALIMLCGCVVLSTVANDVRKTIAAVQEAQQKQQQEAENPGITRSVYVRTHDSAQALEDAQSYKYGIVTHYDDECTQQAIAAIEAQLGAKIQTEGYLSIYEMADALLSGKLDAMILKSGYISVLEADERYSMFSDKTRVLADVQIEGTGEELDGSGLAMNAEADIAENGKLKPFVMYVSGSDSREGVLDDCRSDVNILAAVNPETRQVLLVNTPRDYYVPNPAGDGAPDKLTHCGIYGTKCSMKALGDLYDEEIAYYVKLNFTGFKKLIDAMGGITVESDYEFTAIQRTKIKKGLNELNGQQALDFARERYTLQAGDHDRGRNQMKVIKAVIEKGTSGTTIVSNYSAIMDSIDGMFVMNVPMSLISEVVKRQVADMSGWNIVSFSAKGFGDKLECYSVPGESLYVVRPDEKYTAKASELIDKVFAGETITEDMLAVS